MGKLDLIVTHYDEPWEVGEKFFAMLPLQRGIDFKDLRIIIIQDGKDGALPWRDLLADYPISVKVATIKHSGVSAARNAGIQIAKSDYVMFCDFDDTFSSIHALKKYFDCMNEDTDLIYSWLTLEQNDPDNPFVIERENDIFIHTKMLRRQFLLENKHLRFDPEVTFSEDTLFCKVLNITIDHARVCQIPEYLYTRCYREGSICKNPDNNFRNAVGLFASRKSLIRQYKELGCIMNYTGSVIKTAFDYFYAITSGGYPSPAYFEKEFWEFWKEYKDVFLSASRELIAYENDLSIHEAIHKGFVAIPDITFHDWVASIHNKYAIDEPPVEEE